MLKNTTGDTTIAKEYLLLLSSTTAMPVDEVEGFGEVYKTVVMGWVVVLRPCRHVVMSSQYKNVLRRGLCLSRAILVPANEWLNAGPHVNNSLL